MDSQTEEYDVFTVSDELDLFALHGDMPNFTNHLNKYKNIDWSYALRTLYKQLNPAYPCYKISLEMRDLLFSYPDVKLWLKTKEGIEAIKCLEITNKYKHYGNIVFHDFSKDKIHMSILRGENF